MSRVIRILVVLAVIAMIAMAGVAGVAWASRLNANNPAPTSAPAVSPTSLFVAPTPTVAVVLQDFNTSPNAQGRQKGTVDVTPTCLVTKDPGEFLLGSVANWVLNQVGGGKVYKACITKQKLLPAPPPDGLLSYPIELTVAQGPTLGVDQRVCFPIPLGVGANAYYWSGTAWLKTENAANGQACVTVPASAPSPTYAIVTQAP